MSLDLEKLEKQLDESLDKETKESLIQWLESKRKKKMIDKKYKKFSDYILSQEEKGRVVINTIEGFQEISIDDIIKQPTDGLLYDLNRDRATILTLIDDQKWVNDFACMLVIKKLHKFIKE